MPRSVKVGVIGAGPGGLLAARELRREGHKVTVFEKSTRVGGTWVYDPTTDSDPLSLAPDRVAVHGSLYRSLRTNLPRQLMGFLDYEFPEPSESFVDPRAFPAHKEVLAFLEAFARDFGIVELVRFGAEVVRVWQEGIEGWWAVEWRNTDGMVTAENFDAVVVCNGHHSEPMLAEIPGYGILTLLGNRIICFNPSCDIACRFKYHYPFLQINEFISNEDNRVGPLYKHVFPPPVAPWLSFVGIPNKVIFSLMFELQSRWIARVLSGKVTLPSEEDMMASIETYYQELEHVGRPKHHTHNLHPNEIEYLNWLASEVDLPPIEDWRLQMYRAAIENLKSHNDGYRDNWNAAYWTEKSISVPKRNPESNGNISTEGCE
ncbi:hypothetical protein J5N97_029869 [Dioscorea zingiberensis]|uniref:Flavin-containing monooxygenase n=1 Tax=Dioscorea zingiberensis TaxID=325984 RepID=A0A9D5H3Q1_9LILI|nr:hypothetical protein J5N97_029869 [Dioscorea zingiberensis]